MRKLIKIISILVSILFSLLFILFVLGLSFRVYNINDFNDMIYLSSNDLNIRINSLDYIYKFNFIRNNLLIFCGTLIFISLINIVNRFYASLKYIGSAFMISSSFLLFSLLFIDKIKEIFDSNFIIILNNNLDKFSYKIYSTSTIFLFIGIIMIILYSIIDVLYENHRNKRIIEEKVEIIEGK